MKIVTRFKLAELFCVLLVAIIVAVLFGFTVTVQNYVEADPPNPDLKVDVTAFQWQWKFAYPDHQGADGQPISTLGTSDTIPLLVLPTGEAIELTLQKKSGQQARIAVVAPPAVRIERPQKH